MNEMMVFEGKHVEVIEIDGRVLFNPRHIGECLGLSDITVRRHMQSMNEKQVIKLTNSNVHLVNFRKFHNTGENFLTESGVYKLINKSEKPEAEKFQDWITDEVLPSIRKTGSYSMTQPVKKSVVVIETASLFKAYFEVAQIMGCDKNVSAISANQAATKNTGVNMLEDMGLTHLIAEKQEIFFTPTELSKRISISAAQFNKFLEAKGLQRKVNDKWTPTEEGQKYSKVYDTGKKRSSGTSIEQVKWSESTLKFISE